MPFLPHDVSPRGLVEVATALRDDPLHTDDVVLARHLFGFHTSRHGLYGPDGFVPPDEATPLLDAKEAAAVVGCVPRSIRNWVAWGRMSEFRTWNGELRVCAVELEGMSKWA